MRVTVMLYARTRRTHNVDGSCTYTARNANERAHGHVLRLAGFTGRHNMASKSQTYMSASSAECIDKGFIGIAFVLYSDVRPVGSRGPSIMARRQCRAFAVSC